MSKFIAQLPWFTRVLPLIAMSFLGMALSFATPSHAATPVIFHATESAGPGDVVQLQGAHFGAAPLVSIRRVVSTDTVLTPSQQLTVLNKSDTSVSAQIPAGFPSGLYALWVHNNGILSAPVMVNRARVNQLEFPEINPGRVFRLFGRNLLLSGFGPLVRFVDQTTGASLPGTVAVGTGSDAYAYTIRAPLGLVVGRTYTIYFRNGAGGVWGEVAVAISLPVRSDGTDVFALDVPWGADFAPFYGNVYNVKTDTRLTLHAKGDGITDDKAAIQNAIDVASAAGGGIIQFPTGTYNIVTFTNGVGLNMKSNVVLRGGFRTGTTLRFSPVSDPGFPRAMIMWNNGVTVSGLFQLTVFNNTSNVSYNLIVRDGGPNTSKVFVKDVTIDLNKWGHSLAFVEGSRYLVDNVEVRNASIQGDTLLLALPGGHPRYTSRYAIVRNSKFPNITRRLEGGEDTIIQNSIFTYNGDYQAELAVLQPNLSQDEQNSIEIRDRTIILNNTFGHVGRPFVSHNDGESILNQTEPINITGALQQDSGAATAASDTTLSDTSKNWSALNWTGFIVAITDGPGTGQWRKIVSSSANTVTVGTAWQVVPTNASRYTLMKFGIQTLLVKGNVMQNRQRGIWLFTGGQDAAIVNNTLTDAGGIWVHSFDRKTYKGAPSGQALVAWDILVANNRVTRTAMQAVPPAVATRPAYITVNMYHETSNVIGTGILGVEVRNNAITAVPGPELRDAAAIRRDGYTAAASFVGDNTFGSPDWRKASLRGLIFDRNTATDVQTAYHVSSGAYQTVIANSTETGVVERLQDLGTYYGQLLTGAGWTAGDPTLRAGNQALLLDGVDDRVALGLNLYSNNSSQLAVQAPFTLEARVKITSAGGPHAILDLANGPFTGPQWAIVGGKLWLRTNNQIFTGNALVNDGQWHHVAISYDGANFNFYVNGNLDISRPAANFVFTVGGYGAWLGGGWPPPNSTGRITWPYNGALDEVRIWNVARSAAQISANANRELSGTETGLTNYWRFNEGSGGVAIDTAFPASIDTTLVP